jgi:hypothetical protein
VTRCEVEVIQSLKGKFNAGEQINVDQNGGLAECINEYIENLPFLEEGATYILFLFEPSVAKGMPFFEYMTGAFDTYAQVIDGKVVQHEYSRLFENQMPLEDAVKEIMGAVEEEEARTAALTNLTPEQGAQAVGNILANDPNQAAVRNLTDEEMQTIYNFENDERVWGVSGKLLENSDLFIWIKTHELTLQQREDIQSVLITAAEKVAEERDWGYQVSVTPYHSMIVIARGEDRATILMMFHRVLDDLQE